MAASQGQGLVLAMREVPAPFFQEGFSLDQPDLWEVRRGWAGRCLAQGCGVSGLGSHGAPGPPCPQICDVEDDEARQQTLERLSHYLDVVDTHLVREIAARTGAPHGWGQAAARLRGGGGGAACPQLRGGQSHHSHARPACVPASRQLLQRQRVHS